MLKKAAYWFGVVLIGTFLGFSLQFVKAWTEPIEPPPLGNLDAPINTGPASQYKSGALGIGGVLSADGSLLVSDIFAPGGKNILVGNESYLSDVDINNTLGIYGNQDATQGHIKLGSGGPIISGVSGNVGIGTTTPKTNIDGTGNIDINDAYIRAAGKWASQLGGGGGSISSLYTNTVANAGPVYCDGADKAVSGGCWAVDVCSGSDPVDYGGRPVGENGWQCRDLGCTTETAYVRCVQY